jgi:hypothetical protein
VGSFSTGEGKEGEEKTNRKTMISPVESVTVTSPFSSAYLTWSNSSSHGLSLNNLAAAKSPALGSFNAAFTSASRCPNGLGNSCVIFASETSFSFFPQRTWFETSQKRTTRSVLVARGRDRSTHSVRTGLRESCTAFERESFAGFVGDVELVEKLAEGDPADVDERGGGACLFAGEGERGGERQRVRGPDRRRREREGIDVVWGMRGSEDSVSRVSSGSDEYRGRVVGESVVRGGTREEEEIFGRGGGRVEVVGDGGDGWAKGFSLR